VLERVDRVFAVVTWLAAGIVVVMLLFGPALVAHDQAMGASGTSPYGVTAVNGKQVFIDNCGSCHTLAAAGTTGQVGPSLDHISLSAAPVAVRVRDGSGSMPAFAGRLSDPEIKAVAAFVAGSH
jgi:mono/diheme cytochrome c family protein